MPIYEYQCEKCGHYLEALQKIADKPLRECPECGRHSLRRLVSAPLFRLAGSGWYETDFKSDKETKRNLADKGEAGGESKGEAKSEPAKTDGADKGEGKARTMVTKPALKRSSSTAARKPGAGKAPARKTAAASRARGKR